MQLAQRFEFGFKDDFKLYYFVYVYAFEECAEIQSDKQALRTAVWQIFVLYHNHMILILFFIGLVYQIRLLLVPTGRPDIH